MSFRNDLPLWIAAALPLLLWFLVSRERVRSMIARRFASERLRGSTMPGRGLRPWLLGLALAAALAALAGPYSGFHIVPIDVKEANRVIVIDVSNSMAAADLGSSRLTAAKALAVTLVGAQKGRVALVVFEAVPQVVSPLTSDLEAVASLVETLQPGETGEPGSDLGAAVLAALQLLQGDVAHGGDIVVISDGEDQRGRVGEAVTAASARGIKVSTVLLGTEAGGTIPAADGPLRSESGEIVTTRAHGELLHELAGGTGGHELVNPFAGNALGPLLVAANGGAIEKKESRVPIDRYQWPLSFAFVALLGASLLHRGAE